MDKDYRNFSIGDIFRSQRADDLEQQKLDLLKTVANKSTTTSSLIYIIPIIGLVIGGVIIAIVLKNKRK